MWASFWAWYERTYTLNVSIALCLFLLQIAHLIWLFGAVVWAKVFGAPLFTFNDFWQFAIILVDYTEVPALISVSFIYINELRGKWHIKNALYLAFLNIQWLHLFWITDEFVVASFTGSAPVALPLWLAWVAISIDYLELPVMFDVLMKFITAIKEKRLGDFLRHQLRES
ncbi:hypothetical protein HY969_03960 [Candidatus Kaiserbacteria bacterium]|nr:hypothetical protein [Candidatus Kaiserbacteria bacterium]